MLRVVCFARGVEQLKLSYESVVWGHFCGIIFFSLYFYTIKFSTSFVLKIFVYTEALLLSTSPSACSGMRHKHSAMQFKVGAKAVAEQWLPVGITERRT